MQCSCVLNLLLLAFSRVIGIPCHDQRWVVNEGTLLIWSKLPIPSLVLRTVVSTMIRDQIREHQNMYYYVVITLRSPMSSTGT